MSLRLALVFVLAVAGACGRGDGKVDAPATVPPAHEHHAPHGGSLQVLGDEAAHLELVLDSKFGALTAYVLDGEAENPVRIAQSQVTLALKGPDGATWDLDLDAVASPLTGETIGDTSEFVRADERLRGATRLDGVLRTLTARGLKFEDVAVRHPGGNEQEAADGRR